MKRTRRTTPVGADEEDQKEVSSPDGKQPKLDEDILVEESMIVQSVDANETEIIASDIPEASEDINNIVDETIVDTSEQVIEATVGDTINTETIVIQDHVQDINAIDELPAELSETPIEVNITSNEVSIDTSGQMVDNAHVIQHETTIIQDQYTQEQVIDQQMEANMITPCSIQQQIEQQIQVETQNQLQQAVSNGIQSNVANIDLVAIAANAEHIPVTPQTITPMKRGRGRPRKSAVGITNTPQIVRNSPLKPIIPVIGNDGQIRRSVGRPQLDPNSDMNPTLISPLVTDGASARRARQMKAKKVFEDYEENYVPGKRGKDESSASVTVDDDDYDVPPAPKPRNLVRDMQEAGIESLSVELPVQDLMVSLNTSQQPEIRTLYIFQNTPKNGWLKIICKRLDGIQYYQCPMCPYVDPVPREVADHLNTEHHHMMNIAEGKCTRIFSTFLFMFCRHCDFIAYEKLALWYHYEHFHNLKDMIGSKTVNPDTISMSAFPNLPQSSLLNAKMILRCTECPFLCLSKRHALLHAQKMHSGSHKSHGNGFVAMSQLNERNKPTPLEEGIGQQAVPKPVTTTVNIQAAVNTSLVESALIGGLPTNIEAQLEPTAPLRSMTLKDIFICSECLFITYKRPLMEVHCVNNHARRVLLLVCSMCDAQFDTIYKMSAHIGETHDEIKRQFCSVTVIDQEGKEDNHLKSSDTRRLQAAIDQSTAGMVTQSLLKPGQLNNSQLAVTMQPNNAAHKGPTSLVSGIKVADKSMLTMDSQKFRYVKLPDGRVLQIPAENPGSSQPRYIKLPDGTILKLPMPNDKQPLDIIKKSDMKINPMQMKKLGPNIPTTRYLKMPDGTLHQLPMDGKMNNKSIQIAQKTAAPAKGQVPMRYLKMPDGTLRAITGNMANQLNKGQIPQSIQPIRKTAPPQLKKDVRYLKLPDGSLHEIPPIADGAKSETRYLKLPDGTLHKIPAEFNTPSKTAPAPVPPKPTKFLKMPDGSIKPLNDDGTPAVVPANTRYVQMPDGTIHQINCPEPAPEVVQQEVKLQMDPALNGDANTRYLQMPDGSIQQITSDHPIDKDTRYVQMPDGSIQAIAPGQPLPGEEQQLNQVQQQQVQQQQVQQIADTTTCTASSNDLAMQEQSSTNSQERYLQLPDGSIHPLPEGMDANDPNLKFVQMPDGTIQQVPLDSEDQIDPSQQQQQIIDQSNEQLMLETQQMINASQSAIPDDPQLVADQNTQDIQNGMEQDPGQQQIEDTENQNGLSEEHRQQLISQGIDPNIVQSYIQLPDGTLQPINPGDEEQYQQLANEQQQLIDEQPQEQSQDQQHMTDEQLLEQQQLLQEQQEQGQEQDQQQMMENQQQLDPEQQLVDDSQQEQLQMTDQDQLEDQQQLQEHDPNQQILTDEQQQQQEMLQEQQYAEEQQQAGEQVDDNEYINLESGPDAESRYLRLADGTLLQIPNMPETDQVQFVRLPDNRVLQLPPNGSNEPAMVVKDPIIEQDQDQDQQYMEQGEDQLPQEGEQEQYIQDGLGDQEMTSELQEQDLTPNNETLDEQSMEDQTGDQPIEMSTEQHLDEPMLEQEDETMLEHQEPTLEQEGQSILETEDQSSLEQEVQPLLEQEGEAQPILEEDGQPILEQDDQLLVEQEDQTLVEQQEGQTEVEQEEGQTEVEQQEDQTIDEQEGQTVVEQEEGQTIDEQEGQTVVEQQEDDTIVEQQQEALFNELLAKEALEENETEKTTELGEEIDSAIIADTPEADALPIIEETC